MPGDRTPRYKRGVVMVSNPYRVIGNKPQLAFTKLKSEPDFLIS